MKTALFPPNLSAKKPNIGAKIPQKIICKPIARPNSVLVQFSPSSNALKNNPKVCLSPIETRITEHAESKVMNANLLGINFSDITGYLIYLKDFFKSSIKSFGSSSPI